MANLSWRWSPDGKSAAANFLNMRFDLYRKNDGTWDWNFRYLSVSVDIGFRPVNWGNEPSKELARQACEKCTDEMLAPFIDQKVKDLETLLGEWRGLPFADHPNKVHQTVNVEIPFDLVHRTDAALKKL